MVAALALQPARALPGLLMLMACSQLCLGSWWERGCGVQQLLIAGSVMGVNRGVNCRAREGLLEGEGGELIEIYWLQPRSTCAGDDFGQKGGPAVQLGCVFCCSAGHVGSICQSAECRCILHSAAGSAVG